jgi:hypothetical protein
VDWWKNRKMEPQPRILFDDDRLVEIVFLFVKISRATFREFSCFFDQGELVTTHYPKRPYENTLSKNRRTRSLKMDTEQSFSSDAVSVDVEDEMSSASVPVSVEIEIRLTSEQIEKLPVAQAAIRAFLARKLYRAESS